MSEEELEFTDNTSDEVVVVRMPRRDYRVLRSMIESEKHRSWWIKWILSLGATISALTAGLVFWDKLPF